MLIDKYLPEFQFRERHELEVSAPPAEVLRAAVAYSPTNDPFFRAMIALREFPLRINELIGREASSPHTPSFSMDNFTLLNISEGHEAVFGLAGRLWQMGYGLVPLKNTSEFEAFRQPGSVKLALNFAVTALPDGKTALTTETRVFCLDKEAQLKFTLYWYLIRPISGMLRRKMLLAVQRQSELNR